jgi:RNA polymerase sigma-70 factor (ECF subfamily)
VDTHRENSRFVPLIMDESEFTDDMWKENAHRLKDVHLPSAEHLADLKQQLAALQIIIDSLPKKCREVFWLYGVEGHTQPEIASRLGISLNMVERHVMRALVSLRTECGQFLDQ